MDKLNDNNENKCNNRLERRASKKSVKQEYYNTDDGNKIIINPDKIKVAKLKCGIDNEITTIDESSSAVLKYRTPHFRAVAIVDVPAMEANQAMQIGWIQTCTDMNFVNTYGEDGVTSWEFPEIVLGKYKMVSDADGKQYPWYGLRNETKTIYGESRPQTITVHMNDNFFPQVTWYVPYSKFDRSPRLTSIYREQSFYTFLAAKDLANNQYHVLKTVHWTMQLAISVNPRAPLGNRARVVGPTVQKNPEVLPHNNVILERYALRPPNANNSQTLIWRPSYGEPRIIVPPIESTVEMHKYLNVTRDLDQSLVEFDNQMKEPPQKKRNTRR